MTYLTVTERDNFPPYVWLLISAAFVLLVGMSFGGVEGSFNIGSYVLSSHMFLNAASGLLVIGAGVTGFKQIRRHVNLLIAIGVSLLGLAGNGLLGYFVTFRGTTPRLSGIHYFLAVATLGIIAAAATLAVIYATDLNVSKFTLSNFSRKSILAVGLVLLALGSGVYLSSWGITLSSFGGGFRINNWVSLAHQASMAAIGIYLLFYHRFAWRAHRSSRLVLTLANLLVILFLAQGFVGAMKLAIDAPLYLDVLHKLSGAVLAVVGGVLLITAGFRGGSEDEGASAPSGNRGQRVKDFVTLTKPIVVLLLLATTFGGMVMGAKGLPSWDVILVTLISGALAAGGSGAVNQYLDRDLDGVMARTSKRPIPAGRLTSAEGLAFGVTAIVVAFYLLAGFVNMLAALLTLVGMLYYVFLYSMLLKKRTVQNIVIGGGAGAIPPLVGWAAATGSLDLTAVFLFLIIFLWTPPHFWALALTRANEYRDAGVPMMPVERGDEVTRKMIFQYTVALVFATILMWTLGLAGWLFLGAAVLFGAYLLWLAWKVWKAGRNRIYYQMYRHSNYYLLLIFFILAIDSIILDQ